MTRSADPPARSGKALRRVERKLRQEKERELRRLARQRTVVGALAFVPLLAALSCTWGIAAFWCAVDPSVFLIAFSALGGLYLGGTIRFIRERRALEGRDRS